MRLNIPTPCTQDWDAMTPADQGRHCAACQKVVVDLSRMTDGEIVSWMQARAGQEICGRLETGQLGRELVPALPITRSQPWWSWARVSAAAGALWLVLSANDASAQPRKKIKHLKKLEITVPSIIQARTDVPHIGPESRVANAPTYKREEKERAHYAGSVAIFFDPPIQPDTTVVKKAVELSGVSAERRE